MRGRVPDAAEMRTRETSETTRLRREAAEAGRFTGAGGRRFRSRGLRTGEVLHPAHRGTPEKAEVGFSAKEGEDAAATGTAVPIGGRRALSVRRKKLGMEF